MPDANGRIRGIAVPSSAPWPPERPTPGGYTPDDLDDLDSADALERAWRKETGSVDPQGPPIGWRPGRRRRRA